jgi:hypothetical protein
VEDIFHARNTIRRLDGRARVVCVVGDEPPAEERFDVLKYNSSFTTPALWTRRALIISRIGYQTSIEPSYVQVLLVTTVLWVWPLQVDTRTFTSFVLLITLWTRLASYAVDFGLVLSRGALFTERAAALVGELSFVAW